ncbi:ribonuclease H-like domain-containing protein [Tanacetum coccineum]
MEAHSDTSTTKDNDLFCSDGICGYDWSFQAEEGITNFALMAFTSQVNECELNNIHINESEVVHSMFNSRESDVDDSPINDTFKTGEGFHAVPPPYTGNYMPLRHDLSFAGLDESFAGLDDSIYKTKVSETETNWDTNSDNDSVFRPKPDQTKPKFTKINFFKSNENVKYVNKENTHRQEEYPMKSQNPRDNRRNWNGMMTQKLGNGFEFIKKACFVCGSFNHLIKDCDFHDKKIVEKPVLNNKGRVTGQREIRLVKENHATEGQDKYQLILLSKVLQEQQHQLARPVNTDAPKLKVNDALPKTYSYFKAHSPVRMPFNQKSVAKTDKFNEKVNTARFTRSTYAGLVAMLVLLREKGKMLLSPQHARFRDQQEMLLTIPPKTVDNTCLKDLTMLIYKADSRIFVNRCSRHMTGNKFYLSDYQDIDGRFVTFGGSPKGGKITGKGKIRTGKLDFKDVYFVKELKFNLFSISQMCDKKNSVLFNKTECLVLSPDFKLLDESQVLVKVPKQNNMYSFDLKNVVPSGGLTCLFAKATINESNLWHRRLGHINFKTMNKLVRGNLFRGLPSNLFENDHTCVAFQKGKQHKASWSGPDWLFDIDLLTNSMNYEPITAGNQTNKNACIKDNVDAVPTQQYILLPLLYDSRQSLKDAVADDAGKKTNEEPANKGERNGQEKEGRASNKENDQNVQAFRAKFDNFLIQQKEGYANSTNKDSTVSPSISTVGQNFTHADDLYTDPLIPDLKDTSIFSGA